LYVYVRWSAVIVKAVSNLCNLLYAWIWYQAYQCFFSFILLNTLLLWTKHCNSKTLFFFESENSQAEHATSFRLTFHFICDFFQQIQMVSISNGCFFEQNFHQMTRIYSIVWSLFVKNDNKFEQSKEESKWKRKHVKSIVFNFFFVCHRAYKLVLL
jgi:hypothetical protein